MAPTGLTRYDLEPWLTSTQTESPSRIKELEREVKELKHQLAKANREILMLRKRRSFR